MIIIIKQELNISPILKKKITWASKYTNINITIENGVLIRLGPTNIAHIESHKVIINENTFMSFNEKDIFYINNTESNNKDVKSLTTYSASLNDIKKDLNDNFNTIYELKDENKELDNKNILLNNANEKVKK